MRNVTHYPDLVKLGTPSCQQLYERRRHELLLIFDECLTEAEIEELMRDMDLAHADRVEQWDGVHPMGVGAQRWAVHTQVDDVTPEFAQGLLTRAGGALELVSPVYQEQGKGPGSAVAPMARSLLVKYRDATDKKALGQSVKALKGLRRAQASKALWPFHRVDLFRGPWKKTRPHVREPSRAFASLEEALKQPVVEIAEMDWVTFEATSAPYTPSDTYYSKQWNMTRIGMEDAWSEQLGDPSVIIAIIDPRGFDVTHPDLDFTDTSTHYNTNTTGTDVDYTSMVSDNYHGTTVAGLTAARLDSQGVAGVAGGCLILPIKFEESSATSSTCSTQMFCEAIQHAIDEEAQVLILPLSTTSGATKSAKLDAAWAAGLVVVAAAGQSGCWGSASTVNYPASHESVIAVGPADAGDPANGVEERLHDSSSPDGEDWHAYYGPQLDVLAPGVGLWSTDIQGNLGLNNGMNKTICSQSYPWDSTLHGDMDYTALAGGSSHACPHVGGLAALLFLRYGVPATSAGITNQQVRDIIERTCDKVNQGTGTDQYDYAHTTDRPNGTWHERAGYGRINAGQALRTADLMIPDHSLDTGEVPSCTMVGSQWQPLNFWSHQPFVTNNSMSGATAADHQDPIPLKTNYVHATVRNLGPADASTIHLSWHIVDYPHTALLYPDDFNASNQIAQTTLTSLAAGSETDVEATWLATAVSGAHTFAHPCMLVKVTCDQDVGGDAGNCVWEYNNVAQRNISFAQVSNPVPEPLPERTAILPFASGHRSFPAHDLGLSFDLRRASGARVLLDLHPDDGLPFVGAIRSGEASRRADKHMIALGDVHLGVPMVAGIADLLLKAGSRIRLPFGHGPSPDIHAREFIGKGVEVVTEEGREYLELQGLAARIQFPVDAGEVVALALRIEAPENAVHGDQFAVDVTEMKDFAAVGGVSLHVQVLHDEPHR